MMAWMKLFPMVMFLAGLATMAGGAKDIVSEVIVKVQVSSAVREMRQLRDHLRLSGQSEGVVPEPGNQESLADWVGKAFEADGKDPAYDMWGNPYRFEKVPGDNNLHILLSNGPNTVEDCCMVLKSPEEVAGEILDMLEVAGGLASPTVEQCFENCGAMPCVEDCIAAGSAEALELSEPLLECIDNECFENNIPPCWQVATASACADCVPAPPPPPEEGEEEPDCDDICISVPIEMEISAYKSPGP